MKKRIIPCLDIRDGRVVKGKKFLDVQDVADPVELAKRYEVDQADELFILDITGDNRPQFLSIVKDISEAISIPLSVGGGIRTIEDVREVIAAGASKVSITSAAINNPELLSEVAKEVGSTRVILSIDAGLVGETWHAFTSGGINDTGLDVVTWAKQGEALGVGEILLNSIDKDGVKSGYNLPLNMVVSNAVSIPVIASGGAGDMEDFKHVLIEGKASAALAASVFHYEEIYISDLKEYLLNSGVDVEEV